VGPAVIKIVFLLAVAYFLDQLLNAIIFSGSAILPPDKPLANSPLSAGIVFQTFRALKVLIVEG
jgi:hypothetical protein